MHPAARLYIHEALILLKGQSIDIVLPVIAQYLRSKCIGMGDAAAPVESEETGESLYDVDGISPGGQIYANTELGKYVSRGECNARIQLRTTVTVWRKV